MNEAIKLIQDLERSRFYGSIELKFESGRLTLIRKSETIRPDFRNGETKASHVPQEK